MTKNNENFEEDFNKINLVLNPLLFQDIDMKDISPTTSYAKAELRRERREEILFIENQF